MFLDSNHRFHDDTAISKLKHQRVPQPKKNIKEAQGILGCLKFNWNTLRKEIGESTSPNTIKYTKSSIGSRLAVSKRNFWDDRNVLKLYCPKQQPIITCGY